MDSRDLFYDPRGWWKHTHALKKTAPAGEGRLHRLSRGLSASGLPWGAGSLNEALGGGRGETRESEGGGPGGERGSSPTDSPGKSVGEAQRDRAGVLGGIQRGSRGRGCIRLVLVTDWDFGSGTTKTEEVECVLPRFQSLGPLIDRLPLLCSLRRLLRSAMR